MGAIKGFMQYEREVPASRPVDERLKDHQEVYTPPSSISLDLTPYFFLCQDIHSRLYFLLLTLVQTN